MDKKLLWRACLLGLLLVTLSTSVALAASSQKIDEGILDTTPALTPSETPTPIRWFVQTFTMTPTLEGEETLVPVPPAATLLPTMTLFPPPSGGGRVSVDVLYVREDPSFGSPILSSLFYNDIVLPIGRNSEGDWIAVQWKEGLGWLWESLVSWDPALEITTLKILPVGADLPSAETGVPTTVLPTSLPTVTSTPTTAPSPTNSPSPTSTVPTQPLATALSTPTVQPNLSIPNPFTHMPDSLKAGLLIGGGTIVLGMVVYVWRRSSGMREIRRYAGGFPLDICPACHEGHLTLDEVVHYSMGVPIVRRSVRCDACRSMLRELRPGRWRYTVDPYANPALASRYKNRRLSRSDIEAMERPVRRVVPDDGHFEESNIVFAEQADDSLLDGEEKTREEALGDVEESNVSTDEFSGAAPPSDELDIPSEEG
ncbi:MAG: hypothetical protein JXB07_09565 [Anaerolineae bacterium]|nr:hypothetical protein [Anaerolineae bacterium]